MAGGQIETPMSTPLPQDRAAPADGPLYAAPVLFPDAYVWFVLLSAMDIMLTRLILYFDGYEVNPVARWIIETGGLPGMVVYKFALVLIVITICELVGRVRPRVGRRLAEWAAAITVVPVALAALQLGIGIERWLHH